MPPVATPTRKNISPTFFRYSLSHTRFHSEIHVLPKLSPPSNSHDEHFVAVVELLMSIPSFKQNRCKQWWGPLQIPQLYIYRKPQIILTVGFRLDTKSQFVSAILQLSSDLLKFRQSFIDIALKCCGLWHQKFFSAAWCVL